MYSNNNNKGMDCRTCFYTKCTQGYTIVMAADRGEFSSIESFNLAYTYIFLCDKPLNFISFVYDTRG